MQHGHIILSADFELSVTDVIVSYVTISRQDLALAS
jgi:hypothetical protein